MGDTVCMSLKISLAGDDKSRGGLNFSIHSSALPVWCDIICRLFLHAVHYYHILVCYCCPDETYYLASGYYTYTGAIWKKMKYEDSILSSAPGGRIHIVLNIPSIIPVQHFVHGTISISTGVDCSSKPIRIPSLNSFLATERPSLYRIAASASNLIQFKSILFSASIWWMLL